jgi:LPS-assembly lipoprotein
MIRAAALALAALVLTGCGLRPLYGEEPGSSAAATLRSIAVAPIEGQAGWLLRNKLLDRLDAAGEGNAAYRLDITLDDNITAFVARVSPPARTATGEGNQAEHRPGGRPAEPRSPLFPVLRP